ncbi:MAG: cytochrome C [Nitrospinota bacterium]
MVETNNKRERLLDKVYVWPYLIRIEAICAIICMLILTVWSITIDAPLEEAANPTKTPNPSKAPWYFLGLQEMLVYFDPWMAGVVLPTFIIIGLMVIPFVDTNPKGNGYYTFKERPFAITTFLFGFIVLWVTLIILGVFFRGPGWNLFWPWQEWDPHKVVALTNVNLSEKIGIRSYVLASIFGGAVVIGYYIVGTAAYFFMWRKAIKDMGFNRIGITSFLFLTMMGLVIKVFLRLLFNIKYIWVTPWFNI